MFSVTRTGARGLIELPKGALGRPLRPRGEYIATNRSRVQVGILFSGVWPKKILGKRAPV